MSIPTQKFFVGQEVMVRTISTPSFDTDRAIVNAAEYVGTDTILVSYDARSRSDIGCIPEACWHYSLSHISPQLLIREDCLRPRPDPATRNYDQIIRSLKSTRTNEELETI